MSSRIAALDLAKGSAILFVVMGHIVARSDIAPGAEWYVTFRFLVYSFHMPLFMALSGMSLGASWRHRASSAEVRALIVRRVRQLLVPFLIFGLLVLAGKHVAMHWTPIDNPPQNGLDDLWAIVLTPIKSAVGFLWYVYTLSVYYLVFPWVLQWAPRWSPVAMLLLGVALQPEVLQATQVVAPGFTWTDLMSFQQVIEYLPFFAAGILLGRHWQAVQRRILPARSWPLWLIPVAAALAWNGVKLPQYYVQTLLDSALSDDLLPKWLIGALSIPFILTVHQVLRGRLAQALNLLGQHTLSIYLMNTMFIGLTKAVLKLVVPWAGGWFYLHFVVLGAAGLLMPIVVKKLANRWAPAVAAYL